MPRDVVTTVYQFDELPDDRARERARDWYRSLRDSNDLQPVIDQCVEAGEIIGITFTRHAVRLMGGGTRQDPNVWWSLGYCQGDGACFDGSYAYAPKSKIKVRHEYPRDLALQAIADELFEIQKRYAWSLRATITHRGSGFSPDVECELVDRSFSGTRGPRELLEADAREVREIMRAFCTWIYQSLRTEDEYQSEPAQVDESIRANEYEFLITGERA